MQIFDFEDQIIQNQIHQPWFQGPFFPIPASCQAQAPPAKTAATEMSSVFGKKHEENEDEEEVGWRCSSLFWV